jgi:hypothetical protein
MDKLLSDDFLAHMNELIIGVESDVYRIQMKISELVFEFLTRYNNSIKIQCHLYTDTISGSETFLCNKIFWDEEESIPICVLEDDQQIRWDSLSSAQQFEVLQSIHHAAVSDRLANGSNNQELH